MIDIPLARRKTGNRPGEMPAWRGVPSLLVSMAVCLHADQMQDQPNSWYLGPLAWSLQAFAGRAASTSLVTWLTHGCKAER